MRIFARRSSLLPLAAAAVLFLPGCGYRMASQVSRLPPDIAVIAIPGFVNQTQTFRVEQALAFMIIRQCEQFTEGPGRPRTRSKVELDRRAGEILLFEPLIEQERRELHIHQFYAASSSGRCRDRNTCDATGPIV